MQHPLIAASLVILTMTCSTAPGLAQASPLAPGSRVRVSLVGQRDKLVGTLQEQRVDSLVVALPSENGTRRSFAVDQVTKLETWGKRPGSVGKSWLIGTGAGALLGILVGATAEPACSGSGWCIGPHDQGDMVAVGAAGGAVVGGLIGLVVGATRGDGWVSLDLAMIRPQRARPAVGLSWRVSLPAIRSP